MAAHLHSAASLRTCAGCDGGAVVLVRLRIYEVYADYVLKNPFYEVEQVRPARAL